MIHNGYFKWRVRVLNLLRKSSPDRRLDSEEIRIMERTFGRGQTPEFFVKLLESRDSLSRDTVENVK